MDVLFPETADGAAFPDFFEALGVPDYTYVTEEGPAQGWLNFSYDGKTAWINANVREEDGSWAYLDTQILPFSAPVVITDGAILEENLTLLENQELSQ